MMARGWGFPRVIIRNLFQPNPSIVMQPQSWVVPVGRGYTEPHQIALDRTHKQAPTKQAPTINLRPSQAVVWC